MKTVLFFIVVTICILTSSFAFADIISYTRTSFIPDAMMGIGFCLLSLAKIGKKII